MSLQGLLTRLFKLETISGDGRCPVYLFRWELMRGRAWAVYLHKFVGDDWSRDLHDHPKRFISIGLWGGYVEHTPCGQEEVCRRALDIREPIPGLEHQWEWRAPWVRSFPADHIHRITGPTPERPCWTVVIVGRAVRDWGFWVNGAWTWWRDYLKSPEADQHKACR